MSQNSPNINKSQSETNSTLEQSERVSSKQLSYTSPGKIQASSSQEGPAVIGLSVLPNIGKFKINRELHLSDFYDKTASPDQPSPNPNDEKKKSARIFSPTLLLNEQQEELNAILKQKYSHQNSLQVAQGKQNEDQISQGLSNITSETNEQSQNIQQDEQVKRSLYQQQQEQYTNQEDHQEQKQNQELPRKGENEYDLERIEEVKESQNNSEYEFQRQEMNDEQQQQQISDGKKERRNSKSDEKEKLESVSEENEEQAHKILEAKQEYDLEGDQLKNDDVKEKEETQQNNQNVNNEINDQINKQQDQKEEERQVSPKTESLTLEKNLKDSKGSAEKIIKKEVPQLLKKEEQFQRINPANKSNQKVQSQINTRTSLNDQLNIQLSDKFNNRNSNSLQSKSQQFSSPSGNDQFQGEDQYDRNTGEKEIRIQQSGQQQEIYTIRHEKEVLLKVMRIIDGTATLMNEDYTSVQMPMNFLPSGICCGSMVRLYVDRDEEQEDHQRDSIIELQRAILSDNLFSL